MRLTHGALLFSFATFTAFVALLPTSFSFSRYSGSAVDADFHLTGTHLVKQSSSNDDNYRSETFQESILPDGHLTNVLCLELNWFWVDISLSSLRREFEELDIKFTLISNTEIEERELRTPTPLEYSTKYASSDHDIRHRSFKGYYLWDLAMGALCRENKVEPFDIQADIEAWRPKLLAAYEQIVRDIIIAEELIRRHKPSIILYVQGHVGMSAALRAAAQQAGVPVLSLENSMHKDKLVWDCFSGISTQSKQARVMFDAESIDTAQSKGAIENYFSNIAGIKMKQHESNTFHENREPLPNIMLEGNRTVLYIGQVYNDASIVFGLRDDFVSQSHLIEQLTKIVDEIDAKLVIRLHPKECSGIPGDDMERLTANMMKEHVKKGYTRDVLTFINNNTDKYTWDDCRVYNTYDLIRAADVIVTINSQAGLEAAALGKPLIATGEGFYTGMDFCKDVHSVSELKGSLVEALAGQSGYTSDIPLEVAVKFMYFYVYQYGIPRSATSVRDKALWSASHCVHMRSRNVNNPVGADLV